jgi:hypothetical protein
MAQKSKSKDMVSKVNKKLVMATEFTGFISGFMAQFIQSQGVGKIKVTDILSSWNSQENQERMINMIKLRMPVPEIVKPRKTKDPNAPKRPLSGYMLFSNDKRDEVRKANPEMKMPDIAKELGKMWNELKEKKKKHYMDKASEDKKRYDAEMAEYRPALPVKPKRPVTSYFFFCADKRAEVKNANPEMKVTDISKELGRMWRDDFADEESREKWLNQAANDKERYLEEKAKWIEEHPDEAAIIPKSGRKKKEQIQDEAKEKVQDERNVEDEAKEKVQDERNVEDEAKQKKKPVRNEKKENSRASGMVLFMQQKRREIEEENPEWDTKQVIANMKKQWSGLSKEERDEYNIE